jgi:hypothetical protein
MQTAPEAVPEDVDRSPAASGEMLRDRADVVELALEGVLADPAGPRLVGHDRGMTEPDGAPQPRDIALEQETPEQAAELEAQSDPEPSGDPS